MTLGAADAGGSGLPMCRIIGEGDRQFGPKNLMHVSQMSMRHFMGVFASAISGPHVAVAGSLPHGISSSISSGELFTTVSMCISESLFALGTAGISDSPSDMNFIPSRSTNRLVFGVCCANSNGADTSVGTA